MSAPASICLLRTSAIGDVSHVVPLIRSLQQAWPTTRLTWIIGKTEQPLVGDLPGIRFITFDKKAGWAGIRQVWNTLSGQHFDALLHMQMALRANVLSLGIKAKRRIGYDRARAGDLHGLVVNERIAPCPSPHVLDTIGQFIQPLGLEQTQVRWDIPLPEEARDWAQAQWCDDDQPTLLVSPSSSHALRSWHPARYAAVIDGIAARHWRVVLVGGPAPAERAMADAILAATQSTVLDLTGKDTLKSCWHCLVAPRYC